MQQETPITAAYELFMRARQETAPHRVTPPDANVRTFAQTYRDAILGLVVGDAVGVPFECGWRDQYSVTDMVGYEQGMPGYHEEPIPIGTWSDDSALTFAAIDSFRVCGRWDAADLLERFCDWFYHDAYVPQGQKRFGEGKVTVRALENYRAGVPAQQCGVAEETALGNGSLMRILPLVFYPHTTADIVTVSSVTHAAKTAVMACVCYVELAEKLIAGADKTEAVRAFPWPSCEAFARMAQIDTFDRDEIRSSGHVIETLEAALWCLLRTDSYRDCILTAVNLGRDTDTVAAVAGGLAGIYYGVQCADGDAYANGLPYYSRPGTPADAAHDRGIPAQWVRNLQKGYETYIQFSQGESK